MLHWKEYVGKGCSSFLVIHIAENGRKADGGSSPPLAPKMTTCYNCNRLIENHTTYYHVGIVLCTSCVEKIGGIRLIEKRIRFVAHHDSLQEAGSGQFTDDEWDYITRARIRCINEL